VVKRQATINLGSFSHALSAAEDFATQKGNVWDWNDSSDLDTRILPTGYYGLTGVVVQNGMFTATTSNADPYLFLNMPGSTTIDTSQYKRVSFRMYSAESNGVVNAQFIWIRLDGGSGASDFIPVYPGWGTYTFDLSTNANWTGTVQYFRMDPTAEPSVQFSLDWVRLTKAASATLSWTNTNFDASSRLSLYLAPATDLSRRMVITQNISTTSYNWDYGAFEPGEYKLLALVDDRVSDMVWVTDNQSICIGGVCAPVLSAPANVTVMAGLNITVNRFHIPISNIGGGVLTWTVTYTDTSLLQAETPSGSTSSSANIPVLVNVTGQTAGTYLRQITIDSGSAGSKTVNVTITIVDYLRQVFLPIIMRQ